MSADRLAKIEARLAETSELVSMFPYEYPAWRRRFCGADVPDLVAALRRVRAHHNADDPGGTCSWCSDAGCCYGQPAPCDCLRETYLPTWRGAVTPASC